MLLALAEEYGWREVQFAPGRAVGGDETLWTRFAHNGLDAERRAVLAMLKRQARGAAR
jgi:hypothetical protein